MTKFWEYRQAEVNDDIKENLPEGWHVDPYQVKAGQEEDKKYSGKKYWVYHMYSPGLKADFMFCECQSGFHVIPLVIIGLRDFECKHAKNLRAFLNERKRN